MFGSCRSTDPKPTVKSTLILEPESRIYHAGSPIEILQSYILHNFVIFQLGFKRDIPDSPTLRSRHFLLNYIIISTDIDNK